MKKTILASISVFVISIILCIPVAAKTVDFGNGIVFDSNYYASNNPDVKAVYV